MTRKIVKRSILKKKRKTVYRTAIVSTKQTVLKAYTRVDRAGLVRGGQEGTKYWGPSCFEGPVEGPRSYKIFLHEHTRRNAGEITSSLC